MTTFVLIPGAGTDPQVFNATISALEERGHDAIAPSLPLRNEDAHPSDHATAIVGALDEIPEDLVIVAQSLGAFAGPIAAREVGASRIILVAPMIPQPGETAGAWWANTGHGDAIEDLLGRYGPMRDWGDDAMMEVFLHDVEPAVAEASAALNGEPGAGMFTELWPLDSWPDIPTTVLAPREDRLFPIEFQRRVAKQRLGLEVEEMGDGHLPMLSRPAELAARLVELSAAEAPSPG